MTKHNEEMKIKRIINCEILLLIVLVLILTLLIRNKRINHSKEILKSTLLTLNEKIINDSIEIAKLKRNTILSSINNYFRLDSNIMLESENGQLTNIHNICNGEPKVIFRFNEFNCKTCIYEELALLKDISNIIKKENIIIIASYKRKRDLYISKRINNIEFDVYNLPLGVIKNSIDNLNIPYIFVIDTNLNITNLFIPNENDNELTKKFFSLIQEKFCCNK